MNRALLFLLVFVSSQAFCEEINLLYFSLSQKEIHSEGSIIYYSDSLSNLDKHNYISIEGWNYDSKNKEYKHYCFVKIGNTIHKLISVRRTEEESKTKSIFKNDTVSLIIETKYFKKMSHESYYIKGNLTLISGKSRESHDIFGLVKV
ncbi:MAG: hypothetical protein OQK82_01260 [Candidatus Pacearchaeota archaeon]|nr:hypothetical protein [Candidatus Pacearchaeota archaeon]